MNHLETSSSKNEEPSVAKPSLERHQANQAYSSRESSKASKAEEKLSGLMAHGSKPN